MHKVFIHYIKHHETVSKEEMAIKIKKLRATKKAEDEMDESNKIFYGLMMSFKLDKEQKRAMAQYQKDLHPIYREYKE